MSASRVDVQHVPHLVHRGDHAVGEAGRVALVRHDLPAAAVGTDHVPDGEAVGVEGPEAAVCEGGRGEGRGGDDNLREAVVRLRLEEGRRQPSLRRHPLQHPQVAVHPGADERVAAHARVVAHRGAHRRGARRRRRRRVGEGVGEGARLWRGRPDRLCAAVLEGGGGGGLVSRDGPTTHLCHCELEGHLHHPVGGDAALLERRRSEGVRHHRREVCAGDGRIEAAASLLHRCSERRRQLKVEPARRRGGRRRRVRRHRRRGVEHLVCEAEDRDAVPPRVLKVDGRLCVRGHHELEGLVEPAVDPAPVQHCAVHLAQLLWRRPVQADSEERLVDLLERGCVGGRSGA
mmetsp:Transcript_25886/g.87353  ORF Transcript_25886/g.87353 Transcript_25886/m.87353 type:complete len:346 (-) Transcript_25886:990-2027(-)